MSIFDYIFVTCTILFGLHVAAFVIRKPKWYVTMLGRWLVFGTSQT